MPIQHSIWRVCPHKPEQLPQSSLATEELLESMIVANCGILSDQWMIIGQQERTPYSGRIDLLAISPDSSLVLIELKRNQTPREVVAQSIDYAAWLEELQPSDIANIYGRFHPGQSLQQDFQKRFGHDLDEDGLKKHQIVIVAATLDGSTERIIKYLSMRGIAINIVQFQVFSHANEQFLSRVWLLDTTESQVNSESSPSEAKEPWNGEYYANFGHGDSRSWLEAVKYGFISAGGGSWYANTLKILNPGDRIWVKAPRYGFVGVGRVEGNSQPFASFRVKGDAPATEVLKSGHYHREFIDDPEKCEYFVPVSWLQTVSLEEGVKETGLFGTQNTVCRPRTPKWRTTVERLKQAFTHFTDDEEARRIKTPSSATP
jgi:hypothetical protein